MKTLKSVFQKSLSNLNKGIVLQGNKQTTLGLIHLIVFITSIIGGTVMYFFDMNSFLSLFGLGSVSFLGWLVNRAGYPKSSAAILITALLIVIQYNICSGYGIHDVAIIAWPAFIFFTGLLFGWQVIPYFTGLIMFLAVIAKFFPNAPLFTDYSDTGDLIVMLLILLAFSIIAQSILRSNQHLLQRSQRSDEHFQAIYNSINDAIIICDSQTGSILNFNEKTSELFGYTQQEAALFDASTISSSIPPYTQENALELIKKAAIQGAQHFEWQVKDKSERLFWVDVNMQLATIGGQTQVLISVRDITVRKTAEHQREILYQVHRAVSSQLDADLVAQSAVETIVRLTGYPHVCIALPHEDGAHWVVRGAAGNLAAELGATYPVDQGVIGRAFRTGQTQWVRDILDDPNYLCAVSTANAPALRSELVTPLRRGDHLLGALNIESDRVNLFNEADTRMIQSLADMIALALENARLYGEAQQKITERNQAEVALRESEERYRTLFEQASDGIINLSTDLQILAVNKSFARMHGFSVEEIQSMRLNELDTPESTQLSDERMRRIMAGEIIEFEVEHYHQDGHIFPLAVSTGMISVGGQNIIQAFHRDITERKQAEAKILAALEEKETLLREVHHRVKNNLQAMIALMDMQAGLIADEATRQFLKELEGQARTMALVYEQLYQSVNLARVQMAPYLQQLTYYISETFGSRRMVPLNLDVGSVALDVAQAMPCGLIVNELFTNILKHAFPPGFQGQPMVHITLQFDGETYHLTVADNGVGLPPGHDWQASRSLGLRLIHLWVTHQLGGALIISGDRGATFTITFPNPQGVLREATGESS